MYAKFSISYRLQSREKRIFGDLKILRLFFSFLLTSLSAPVFASCATTPSSGTSSDALQLAAQTAVYQMATPLQDVLVWTIDQDNALSTHWVRGNHASGTIVASRSGLLIPANSGLWELREVEVEVPLCDCERWTNKKRMGECPRAEEVAYANLPRLVDLITGSEVELLPKPATQEENDLVDSRFSSTVSVTGSVGPYLFISQIVERTPCGEGRASWISTFRVFDLQNKRPVKLFDPDERQRVLENEQTIAYEQFRSDPNIDIKSPADLELTLMEVSLLPGVGLALSYRFTVRAFFADSKGNRSAYIRSTTIAAKELPRALIPFAEFPSGLRRFVVLGEGIRVGGWFSITHDDIERVHANNAFNVKNNTN